jgi:hypothetical protein
MRIVRVAILCGLVLACVTLSGCMSVGAVAIGLPLEVALGLPAAAVQGIGGAKKGHGGSGYTSPVYLDHDRHQRYPMREAPRTNPPPRSARTPAKQPKTVYYDSQGYQHER